MFIKESTYLALNSCVTLLSLDSPRRNSTGATALGASSSGPSSASMPSAYLITAKCFVPSDGTSESSTVILVGALGPRLGILVDPDDGSPLCFLSLEDPVSFQWSLLISMHLSSPPDAPACPPLPEESLGAATQATDAWTAVIRYDICNRQPPRTDSTRQLQYIPSRHPSQVGSGDVPPTFFQPCTESHPRRWMLRIPRSLAPASFPSRSRRHRSSIAALSHDIPHGARGVDISLLALRHQHPAYWQANIPLTGGAVHLSISQLRLTSFPRRGARTFHGRPSRWSKQTTRYAALAATTSLLAQRQAHLADLVANFPSISTGRRADPSQLATLNRCRRVASELRNTLRGSTLTPHSWGEAGLRLAFGPSSTCILPSSWNSTISVSRRAYSFR